MMRLVETTLSVAELLSVAAIPLSERRRFYGAPWPVQRPDPRLQLTVEHFTAEDGTVHVAFAFPWPGRPGYVIGWRGVVCRACNGVQVAANRPWACPVEECTCPR